MNYKEIAELINLVDKSNINELQVEQDNFKINIKKGFEVKEIYLDEHKKSTRKNNEKNFNDEKDLKENTTQEEGLYIIKSPIVGAFYTSPNPEAEPYVKPGKKVNKGDVLCIIEAMKLMNEINCDVDGEIVEVLAKNQELVEFGQPLFSIRAV